MTLREALIAAAHPASGEVYRLNVSCGFEPLHLITFLKAHLRSVLPEDRRIEISTGRFGDLRGNVERALSDGGSDLTIVFIEWADIDPRLGLREAYRITRDFESSILAESAIRLARLESLVTATAAKRRIVLFRPSAPLPPWMAGPAGQSAAVILDLSALLAGFVARCADAGVVIAAEAPNLTNAYDLRSHMASGFPYTIAYTDHAAAAAARLIVPSATKKGLVTDLDNTMWLGIVGDDGAANVQWSLDGHARIHGIYQQFLAMLARQGILIGSASKNDPDPVEEVLARADLLLPPKTIFPVLTNWGPKSESLRQIARAWNIGLDAIVFVDDNPLELAEVEQQCPAVECHLFPHEPNAALELMQRLSQRFMAKRRVSEEDRLRAASLQAAVEMRAAASSALDPDALMSGLEAQITFDFGVEEFDPRAFELLNKTNQFNLNGRRWEESDFRREIAKPDAVLCVAAYEDRFGRLGKIGVAVGAMKGDTLRLRSWVLSCRAFSRRIEYSMLEALFHCTGVDAVEFDWQSTPRNGPTREIFLHFFETVPDAGSLLLRKAAFEKRRPKLYAAVQNLGTRVTKGPKR